MAQTKNSVAAQRAKPPVCGLCGRELPGDLALPDMCDQCRDRARRARERDLELDEHGD
jgi:hypothetical protein